MLAVCATMCRRAFVCSYLCMCVCVCVCTLSIEGDRKEADLAYLFKSLLTVAEELYSDLQPALRASDLVLHHKNRDSSATPVMQKHNNNRVISNLFLLYKTLCVSFHHAHGPTHVHIGRIEAL